ncbi:sphingomyelin phosphodiesterase [Photobacterium leiognathi]|uniref:sphingomyelin phosphodiesterase n=1 Tax=Photobacterium leiognathi TaxID=553611 RepID=UPI0027343329|nr:sphingomyelin phosphodiesterase [Photobacterium leiognathi]
MYIKCFLFSLTIILSSYCYADTYIYLTNNSSEILDIRVNHTGYSGDTMQKREEWNQNAYTVKPWETKKVLTFNRNVGVKNNKSYKFSTEVTSESGSKVYLEQMLRGSFWGSSIKYKLSASGVTSYYKNNYSIHRFTSKKYSDSPTELAFRSKQTDGFDDIYYTITPSQNSKSSTTVSSTLKMLTYNIWALTPLASHVNQRLNELPKFLSNYDVIALQEVFYSDKRRSFLQKLAKEYPYQTKVLKAPSFYGLNVYDGGVIIVSKYPIVSKDYHVFSRCSGSDCLADKGVVYAEVVKGGKSYHVFATHAASTDSYSARVDRIYQFWDINKFAKRQNIPKNEVVIFSGDFNVNKNKYFNHDYKWMQSLLNANEPKYSGHTAATYDKSLNSFVKSNSEYLDYVFVSNVYGKVKSNVNRVFIPRTTSNSLWYHWDLSDHFPVEAIIKQ